MTKRLILIATLSATLAACGPTREEILRQERLEAEQRARQEAEWNRLRSIKSKVKPKEAPFEVTFVDSNNGGAIIKVQSKHDQLIVQNIIVNRGNCTVSDVDSGAWSYNQIVPRVLRFGDVKGGIFVSCRPIEITVETDVGTYTFKPDRH